MRLKEMLEAAVRDISSTRNLSLPRFKKSWLGQESEQRLNVVCADLLKRISWIQD